jgi:hypothetical protein
MNIIGLAKYFISKYGIDELSDNKPSIITTPAQKPQGNPHDRSFGKPINRDKARILKDKLILVYDKLNREITKLPAFQYINKALSGEHYLNVFNDLINSYVVFVENSSLYDIFSYSIRLIDALNSLRDAIVRTKISRDELIQLDMNIKSVQDTIWKQSKRILNIHDLRGLELEFPELKDIIDKAVPTWDFGPGKNPAKGLLRQQRRERIPSMIKRLQDKG